MSGNRNDDQVWAIVSGVAIFVLSLALFPFLLLYFLRKPLFKWVISLNKGDVFKVHRAFAIAWVTSFYLSFICFYFQIVGVLRVSSVAIFISLAVFWLSFYLRDWFIDKLKLKRLETSLTENVVKFDENSSLYQEKKEKVFLGKSKVDGKNVFLSSDKRSYHSLIVGASGYGKTSLLKVLSFHSFVHNNPCVIIEPKGDVSLQNEIIEMFNHLRGTNSGKKLKVFRFGDLKNSIKYNPLRYGNTTNLVETIMSSFDFSEQYYMNACRDFLGNSIQLLRDIGIVVTFEKLSLIEKKDEKFLSEIKMIIKGLESKSDVDECNILFDEIDSIDRKLLSGLRSQLGYYTKKEVKEQFNPSETDEQIDLREVYSNGDVLLVDLNTNNNLEAGRLIGKFISNDILRLSSQIGQKTIKKSSKDLMVYIDEFSSIANAKAEDMLQKCRSAGIALHFFVQSFSDYREGEKAQELAKVLTAMLGNTHHKFIFKTSLSDDVEEICNQMGTLNVTKYSYQVDINLLGKAKRSGVGMERNTKEFRVEHDLIKLLKPGECVVFAGKDLNNNPEFANIWNIKKDDLLSWNEDYTRRWDESFRGDLSFNFPIDVY